ncbi:MAG: flagellar basal body L-ring protein FlgH [Burkholderiaceae bacterium]
MSLSDMISFASPACCRIGRIATTLLLAISLSACSVFSTPRVEVRTTPSTQQVGMKPSPAETASRVQVAPPSNGAIFQIGRHRSLFEDQRARLVGDTLTIQIQEKTSARQSSTSAIDRSGSLSGSIGALPFVSASSLGKLSADGKSANTFEGKGETGSDNLFTGTITVTVIEVLPNGNLSVTGEKQVGVNQNVDVLRFSGIVNPRTVLPDNTVSSTQVADARVEFRGRGDIDRAQTVGWLARFFLSFLPI